MTRKPTSGAILLLLFLTTGPVLAGVDMGPVEHHLTRVESQVRSQGPKSFVRRGPTGKIIERYVVTGDSESDYQYNGDGSLKQQWSVHKNGSLVFETFYAPRLTKERLLEDDRSISYTSFYRNRQKWEQYACNKQKGLRSYYVYDRDGHLLSGDL